ncbi:class I SAM-dependent methyltransferase [uncultured Legionella sp.]|uniref:class I SAM-dependent methyltransferase n=1 Tax=uncultured Legionella sp. TaxID=210934 RepID=UPI00261F4B99|nr:class I SAM-dependent methyltransferase [uncultured Legionella sp.]
MSSHWDIHATQWNNIEGPLRPSVSDLQILHSWVTTAIGLSSQPFNVLILGATPELAAFPWPENTHLFTIDANLAMIKSQLSQEQLSLSPFKLVGNWLQLPLPDASMHLVVGDGCYSMLAGKDYDALSNEIIRVLQPNGHFFMRFFVRPAAQESIECIQNDFLSGTIENFHILKWRIAMALHGSLEQGVCLKDIWNTWNKYFKHHTHCLPWSKQTVNTIDAYKNNPAFYTFPTFTEIGLKLGCKFNQLEVFFPTYALGERCPSFKLKPA